MDMSYIINTKDKPVPSKLIAVNPNTGLPVELSAIQNVATGEFNLPVVNVGHVAYNQVDDVYKFEDRTSSKHIISHVSNRFQTTHASVLIGTNFPTFPNIKSQPIDISNTEKRAIVVINNHDLSIYFKAYGTYSLSPVTRDDFISNVDTMGFELISEPLTIPSGGKVILTSKEIPYLNEPFVGLLFQAYRNSSPDPLTGDFIINVLGR